MLYCSTRNRLSTVSASTAIRRGIAPEGGLYLPCECPKLSINDILSLGKETYPVRAAKILSLLLTGYTYDSLLSFTQKAYAADRFPENNPVPVIDIGNNNYVLELFHGPTSAFKDVALQMLPYLLTEAMRMEGVSESVLILTATSGDTGSAAMTGFSDVPGTQICVFYPEGGTSLLQRLQMTTQKGKNVFACAVKGNFDDAQSGVKKIFADSAINERLKDKGILLSSANSINFGRLAPQIVYYFSAYLDLVNANKIKAGDKVDIAVPTGNFGNILSARYAREMGLPVGKLICASNSNNVLFEFIKTGTYNKNRPFFRTVSPSMDILVSSNLERLLYLLSGGDDELVTALMNSLSTTGQYGIPPSMKTELDNEFISYWADEYETSSAIGSIFRDTGYLTDTHTAVALNAVRQYRAETETSHPVIVAATASPYKFPGTVLSALQEKVPENEFDMLDKLAETSRTPVPKQLSDLKCAAERFTGSVDKDKMASVLCFAEEINQ